MGVAVPITVGCCASDGNTASVQIKGESVAVAVRGRATIATVGVAGTGAITGGVATTTRGIETVGGLSVFAWRRLHPTQTTPQTLKLRPRRIFFMFTGTAIIHCCRVVASQQAQQNASVSFDRLFQIHYNEWKRIYGGVGPRRCCVCSTSLWALNGCCAATLSPYARTASRVLSYSSSETLAIGSEIPSATSKRTL